MTKTTLIKNLKDKEIDTTVIEQYISEHLLDADDLFKKDLPKLTYTQVCGVLKMCEPFRPYFSHTEFSRLVCNMVISFTKLHAAALSSFSKYKELNVRSFATPNKELPKFLLTQCSTSGRACRCDTYGGPYTEII